MVEEERRYGKLFISFFRFLFVSVIYLVMYEFKGIKNLILFCVLKEIRVNNNVYYNI